MDSDILHTVLLVIILLFVTAIIIAKTKKGIAMLTIQKWSIMNFKKFVLEIVHIYILFR